jgi:hypothetical protein
MSNITKPFNADDITIDNWDRVLEVRKKPSIGYAIQLNFPEGFEVTTKEGKLQGKPGDYLMIGVEGEKYPIDKDIFKKTYNIVGIRKQEPTDYYEKVTGVKNSG